MTTTESIVGDGAGPARERGWLVKPIISRETSDAAYVTRRVQVWKDCVPLAYDADGKRKQELVSVLADVPVTAVEQVHHVDQRAGAVLTCYPGGLRLVAHKPGPEPNRANPGVRGQIQGFSVDSRRRLMRKLQEIDWRQGAVHFITLTYAECAGSDFATWKKHLGLFGDRLAYHYGDVFRGLLWRLEFQTRKSGVQVGQVMPHFHILVFWRTAKGPDIKKFRAWCAGAWHEIADPTSEKHAKAGTSVIRARNTSGPDMSRLFAYLSKYCAKVQKCRLVDASTGELLPTGRPWGVQGDLPSVVIGSFDLTPEQHAGFVFAVNRFGENIGSTYFQKISTVWSGFSLFGDGCDLLDQLFKDIAGDLQFLAGSARGAL